MIDLYCYSESGSKDLYNVYMLRRSLEGELVWSLHDRWGNSEIGLKYLLQMYPSAIYIKGLCNSTIRDYIIPYKESDLNGNLQSDIPPLST